jgi:hypothetical protein
MVIWKSLDCFCTIALAKTRIQKTRMARLDFTLLHKMVIWKSPDCFCSILLLKLHVGCSIYRKSVLCVFTRPWDHRAMAARPPTLAADPSSAPLRPSTWFLYHLVTSLLMMATTWFGDLSAATPPRFVADATVRNSMLRLPRTSLFCSSRVWLPLV